MMLGRAPGARAQLRSKPMYRPPAAPNKNDAGRGAGRPPPAGANPLVPPAGGAVEPCPLGEECGVDVVATADLVARQEPPQAHLAARVDPVGAQLDVADDRQEV